MYNVLYDYDIPQEIYIGVNILYQMYFYSHESFKLIPSLPNEGFVYFSKPQIIVAEFYAWAMINEYQWHFSKMTGHSAPPHNKSGSYSI